MPREPKKISQLMLQLLFITGIIICSQKSFSFPVSHIDVQGNKRIADITVKSYLPFKKGHDFQPSDSIRVLRALYRTGFFNDVQVSRRNGTLIVTVKEKPVIGRFRTFGNREIPKERLDEIFQEQGLGVGRIYDASLLEKIRDGLKEQYVSRGKYNVKVTTSVRMLPRNRVDIKLNISEGLDTKIRSIKILGNRVFNKSQLLKELELSTPGLLTFFSGKDQYTKDKMDQSLEKLKIFYMDNGYVNFKVLSHQASLTPDRKYVYITIRVKEGPQFVLTDYKFTGNLVGSKTDYHKLVKFKKGKTFSREKVIATIEEIRNYLSNRGYALAVVDAQPDINDRNRTVKLNFYVNPGKPIYVRRIDFTGNHKTADFVLRRALRQYEGALLGFDKVKESRRQLRLLTYIDNVDVQQTQVPGTNNQVDLNFNIKEARAAEVSVSAGYGTNGFEFRAGLNHYNFLGTGNQLGLNWRLDSLGKVYSLNWRNPHNDYGFAHGFDFYYQSTNPGKKLLNNKVDVSTYSTDRFGLGMDLDFPVNDYNTINSRIEYSYMRVTNLGSSPSTQLQAFTNTYGRRFPQLKFSLGWTFNSYDQWPFPNKGYKHNLTGMYAMKAGPGGLNYYKLNATSQIYIPLFLGHTLSLRAGVGYGLGINPNRELPFFENYFAGGIGATGQARGFKSYSLGPLDSRQNPLGGNLVIHGNLRLILPFPKDSRTIRFYLFVDGANVYRTFRRTNTAGTVPHKAMRYTYGIAFDWRSPFGPLSFSLAAPFKQYDGDETEVFQFNISSGF